ncbi:hypothetical protein TWF694_003140 [Orbilia ellipsospora]|uniref:SCP domain-containing protein n=1 Tax=Orbilia ellipsospora TaxID=2528407 RepID=A0AAV9X1W6_9PEZI
MWSSLAYSAILVSLLGTTGLAVPLDARSQPATGGAPTTGNQPGNKQSYQAPTNAGSFVPVEQYKDQMLKMHNDVRALHGVPPLTWSQDLVNYGQSHSQHCVYGHSRTLQQDRIGENILQGGGDPVQMGRQLWYENELRQYNFNNQGFSMATGHLTAMIWKSTQEVGCSMQKCGYQNIVKCNFRPQGNMQGAFPANVFPPKGGSTSNNNYQSNQGGNQPSRQQNGNNYSGSTQPSRPYTPNGSNDYSPNRPGSTAGSPSQNRQQKYGNQGQRQPAQYSQDNGSRQSSNPYQNYNTYQTYN